MSTLLFGSRRCSFLLKFFFSIFQFFFFRMTGAEIGDTVGEYSLVRALGKGTYGCVYEGVHELSGEKKALKKIKFSIKYENIYLVFREISILKFLNHKNIIPLDDVFVPPPSGESSDCIYLITPLCDSDLRWWVRKNYTDRKVPVKIVCDLISQIGSAIQYLHSNKIMHRDLKPQNILMSKNRILKIADFGLSKIYRKNKITMTHEIVTLWYRPPEVILGAPQYDESIDMWSIGVIMAELLGGVNPFNGRNEVETLMKIFQLIGTPKYMGVEKLVNFSLKFPKWPQTDSLLRWENRLPPCGVLAELIHMLVRTDPKERINASKFMALLDIN